MNYFSSLKSLNDYRASTAISQSFLKAVLANNVKKEFKETIPMILGSYLDSCLTTPELTSDLFQVGLSKRPSDAIKGFLDDVFKQALIELEELIQEDVIYPVINPNLEVWKLKVMMKVKEANYQPKWGDDAVWKSIKTDGESYWEELVSSQGKMLITQEEKEKCDNITQLACSSHITGKYFIEQEEVEKYYQKDLYWTYENLSCKGLLDILIFEEQTKTIYIIDIKSTGVYSIKEWFNVCRTKSYPFQMSWYKLGVEQNYKDLIEEGWKIKCRWVVIPTEIFKPWIVPCTELMLKLGKEGYYKSKTMFYLSDKKDKTFYGQEFIQGFDEAIQRYKVKEEKKLLDYDIEYATLDGKPNDKYANMMYFT